ncbi:MAG: hypothetical protein FJZ01_14180 [Candidatus Sericytochromatia bacterium]|nr:hypothetical protein [Candidatus Tanganyikabacteria bacterium]
MSLRIRGERQTLPRPSAPRPAPAPSKRRGLWDVLVYSTPALDQLQQAWALAGGANGAARTAASVPGMVDGLAGVPALSRLGVLGLIERVIGSAAFRTVAGFLARPAVQTVGRVAGRVAPFIAAGFAFFDLRTAYRTQNDPQAGDLRKTLKWLKAGLSTVSAGAGFATLALAPTGVGAVVAGAVALVAGLAAMGLDFLTEKIAPK